MTTAHLYDNFLGPWNENTTAGANVSYGMVFSPQADGFISRVRWYRIASGGSRKPSRLQLWRVSTQTLLWETTNPVDSTAVGAQDTTVSPNVAVLAGQEYVVVAHLLNGQNHAYIAGGSVPTYGPGLNQPSNFRRYVLNSTGFPINADNAWGENIDVEYTTDEVSEPTDDPATSLDVENSLARWFSSGDDNTRQEHLPWLTHALATSIQTATNETLELVEALATFGTAVAFGSPEEKVQSVGAVLRAIWTNTDAGVPRMETSIKDRTATAETNILNAISGIEPGVGGGVIPAYDGGADWTAGITVAGQGSHVLVEPADAYVFTVMDMVESARFVQAVGTEEIVWLRGWAKPWDGSLFGGEHVNVNGHGCVIESGRRWPGVAFWVPPDVEWTLTAYDYTPGGGS